MTASRSEFLPPNAGPTAAAVAALDQALLQAIPSIPPLAVDDSMRIKGQPVQFLTAPGLINLVQPALNAQSIIISSCYQLVGGGFVFTTVLSHVPSGGWRSSSFPVGNPVEPAKAAGAGTWGIRSNLKALLGRAEQELDNPQPQAAPASAGASVWDVPAPQQPAPAAAAPAPAGGGWPAAAPQPATTDQPATTPSSVPARWPTATTAPPAPAPGDPF